MDAYSASASTTGMLPPNQSSDQQDETILLDLSYFDSRMEGDMSYNLLDMPPEMYEAFSQVEPLSVTMDPGFDVY